MMLELLVGCGLLKMNGLNIKIVRESLFVYIVGGFFFLFFMLYSFLKRGMNMVGICVIFEMKQYMKVVVKVFLIDEKLLKDVNKMVKSEELFCFGFVVSGQLEGLIGMLSGFL